MTTKSFLEEKVATAAGIAGDQRRMHLAAQLASLNTMTSQHIIEFVTRYVPASSTVPPVSQRSQESGGQNIDAVVQKSSTGFNVNPSAVYAKRAKDRAARAGREA